MFYFNLSKMIKYLYISIYFYLYHAFISKNMFFLSQVHILFYIESSNYCLFNLNIKYIKRWNSIYHYRYFIYITFEISFLICAQYDIIIIINHIASNFEIF